MQAEAGPPSLASQPMGAPGVSGGFQPGPYGPLGQVGSLCPAHTLCFSISLVVMFLRRTIGAAICSFLRHDTVIFEFYWA